jgi:hypothetical protein
MILENTQTGIVPWGPAQTFEAAKFEFAPVGPRGHSQQTAIFRS